MKPAATEHPVRIRRKSLGLTLEKLSAKCGVQPAAISIVERGEVQFPRADNCARIAAGLGVSSDVLVAEIEAWNDTHRVPRKAS